MRAEELEGAVHQVQPHARSLARLPRLVQGSSGDFHSSARRASASSFRGKLDHVDDLEFPLIVKPANEDGSVGIDCGAVVRGCAR